MSWKTGYILKVSYFLHEIICYKLLQHPTSVFLWYLDVCKIIRISDSGNDVSGNGLFQISGETSCLFKTSIWQATKTCTLAAALDFLEDVSHHFVFCIRDPRFFQRVAPKMISRRFVKLSIIKYYRIRSKSS